MELARVSLLKERPMPNSRNKRSLRVAAGVAALTLPLGLTVPVLADEISEPSPTVETSTGTNPTQAIPADPTPVDPTQTTPADPTPAGPTQDPEPEAVIDAVASPEPSPEADIFGDNSYAIFGFDAGVDSQVELESPTTLETFSTAAGYVNKLYLNDRWSGKANIEFEWGNSSYSVLAGDWNGDGSDTVAVRDGRLFAFADANPASSAPKFTIGYGTPGDIVLVGDWDGDGKDTFAVRRGNEFHIRNSLTSGSADRIIAYGTPSDVVEVGDWDGDGKDTLAVRRGNAYHVRNSMSSGKADAIIAYGTAEDMVVVGDWDGDGKDTLAVRRGNAYHVRNSMTSGKADTVVAYGTATDTTIVGDWDGNGADTLGVVRKVSTSVSTSPPASANTKGAEVLAFAKKFDGAPYVWGGTTPAGWDCIGMVRYVYKQFGVDIGGYPHSVLAAGRQIPFSQAQPGDILYWSKENSIANNADVSLYVDATTNFGAWNVSMGTREGKNSWVGGTPIVIRIFD